MVRRGAALGTLCGGVAVAMGALLLVGGLLYPLGATAARTNRYRGPATLDGSAWMDLARPGDAEAIRWLLHTVPGRPVILEAVGDDYSEFSRVSTFAGLPTLVGWIGHELQWRGPLNEYQQRQQMVESVYRNADSASMIQILQNNRVDYVYVGRMEADKYGAGVYDRFEGRLDTVYRGGEVAIYRVPERPSGVGVGLSAVRP
jgi:uncharacterized membrane protein